MEARRAAPAEHDSRVDVLGVRVCPIDIPAALARFDEWIARGDPNYVCVSGVHGVMESRSDPALRAIHNRAGLVTPDGMPLVWLCGLAGHRRTRRVYGPDLLLAACERSLRTGAKHFFYGGADGVPELLAARLSERFPGLAVAGTHSPPFRPLTPDEDAAIVRMINDSSADIVWVGLSTPKQERWMAAHVGRLSAPVLVGVGAAFDFHAGLKRQAPAWMQRSGLEWLFRLLQEPRRLGPRYLVNNPKFILALAGRAFRERATWFQPGTAATSNSTGGDGGGAATGAAARSTRDWGAKGFWAILDQGLFSVANFGLNLVLARWLMPDDYGAFALSYSAILLVGALHSGLLIEPMLVFGPGAFREKLARYFATLNAGNLAAAIGASGLLVAAALIARLAGSATLGVALFGAAAACPGLLFQWFARRACYVRFQPSLAAASGLLYLVLLASGTGVLYTAEALTAFSALAWVGVAGLASAALIVRRLPFAWAGADERGELIRSVATEHWKYGRWAVATGLLIWIPGQIYYMLLPAWAGLEASGVLKAMTNLIMPVLQPYAALAVLLTPALVRARSTGRFAKVVGWGVAAALGGAIAYWAVLAAIGGWLVDWLYGGAYNDHTGLLLVVGLIPVAGAAVAVLGPALRALERPDLVFRAYAASTVVALTVGIGLMATNGAAGAAAAIALSSLVTSLVLGMLLVGLLRADEKLEYAAPGGVTKAVLDG